MNGSEEAPAGHSHDTAIDDVTDAVHAGHGDTIHVENVELAATRAADRLRRALSDDDETRAQLAEVLQHLSALQAQLGEWKDLHRLLYQLLAAFAPFHANLRALGHAEAGPANGRALLQGWRPCQTAVDRLMDFESSVAYIPIPHRQKGRPATHPDWGARIAALRLEVEDRLREEQWSTHGLVDLADEFNQACDCYLSLADRELRRDVERVERLYTHLLGGLS